VRQVFYLPMPPSVNELFFNKAGKGRVKTTKYQAWLTAAGWHLNIQKAKPMTGEALVYLSIYRKDKRGDLDNRTKAILDLAVAHKIIRDDRDVVHIAAKWVSKPHVDFFGKSADVLLKIATRGK
jgi:Holliday junction resolvase RusA-like endonuclease